ncbi:MAG: transglycosylase SLT domain-containing protein [Proteobacteria bacterium]|nr:transglycosylase SLT domain-containing protein [Pseudomonadota bacterium]
MLRPLLILSLLIAAPAAASECGDYTADDALPANYQALIAAEYVLDQGRHAEADKILANAMNFPPGPAARRAELLRGRTWIEVSRLAEARTLLNGLLPSVAAPGHRPEPCDADPAEVRWWLAEGAVRRGEPAAAVPVWQGIWARNPTSARAEEAAAKLDEAGHPVPDPDSARGRELIHERATALQKRQRHVDALALLDTLPDDGTDGLRRTVAQAAFKARKYPRAVQLFGTLQKPTPQDRFDRALAASRTGDYANAAVIYGALVEAYVDVPGKPPQPVDSASYKLGYLAYDAGDLERGIGLFSEHLQRYPTSKHADEALWFMGWSSIRLERWDGADAFFGKLVQENPTSSLAAGAAWWQARAAGIQGDPATEAAGFAKVIEEFPDSSYAWFASDALGRTWKAPVADASAGSTTAEGGPEGIGVAIALLESGLDSWAQAELRAARKELSGKTQSLDVAMLLARAGAWSESRKIALKYCGKPSQQADLRALKLCWPRPGGRELADAAVAAGLPRNLPFAIMRAESGFNPTVVSGAGARGLMQLMPKLGAAQWAEMHPDEPWNEDMLFDPAINMELGTAELAALHRSLDSVGADPLVPLIIAGYNAGESPVRRWLEAQSAPLEVDRWAETISYSETRRYVRRVLGTLQVYRYVYGG